MKAPLSKLPNVRTTIFTTIGKLAVEHNAINMAQGFPNFDTDPELIRLTNEAMLAGKNQYAPMQGQYALREIIAEKVYQLYGRSYHPENEITITVGATQAIFTAITAFVNPGDEVIVFKPAYDCYEPAIELNGGVVVPLALSDTYQIDWKEFKKAITPKTKMVLINTPHNPSGTILSKTDMENLETSLAGTDILVLSDEVYEHIIFDKAAHESVAKYPGLANRSLFCASFGKTFHITGWKMGYCIAPEHLMKEFNKVHQYNVFCVNHPMQAAIAHYLKNPETYLALGEFYQQKRDYFLSAISTSKFKSLPCQGTYFVLLDYAVLSEEKDMDYAQYLITEKGIASIPISVFTHNHIDNQQLRFCFAKRKETLEKAAELINKL